MGQTVVEPSTGFEPASIQLRCSRVETVSDTKAYFKRRRRELNSFFTICSRNTAASELRHELVEPLSNSTNITILLYEHTTAQIINLENKPGTL